MPNITKYAYRKYCRTCMDYVIHETVKDTKETYLNLDYDLLDENGNKIYVCNSCNSRYESTPLSYIADDKIEKQRSRYRQYRKNEQAEMFAFYQRNLLNDMLCEPSIGYKVIESDAGLNKILELEHQKKIKEKQTLREFIDKYENKVERNQQCLCESGKKYKKCCLIKVQQAQEEIKNIR